MKNTFKALKLSSIALCITLSFIACDKDFNSIESDVLGKDNANFSTGNLNLPILAYNKKLDSLRVNGLQSNLFGVFNDPAYGQTTASIIAQIAPASYNPDFGDNTAIDSVILNIPYFSKIEGTEDGITKYSINDSLYGSSPIKLSIYQNNYFLRDSNLDSDIDEPQGYYSKADGSINNTDNFAITDNEVINFDTNKGDLIFQNTDFTPSSDAITTTTGTGDDKETESTAPALRAKLTHDFWQSLIIDKEGDAVLSNINNFKNYFRGLYLKAEAINGVGNMFFLNLSENANITIYYSQDLPTEGEREQNAYVLNFSGNILNTFINNYSGVTLVNGNKSTGDEKLYLKGSEGSMAIVDLFNGTVDCDGTTETALDCFKKEYRKTDANGNFIKENGHFVLKKLINEAQLVIYEDETITTPSPEYHKYDRLYVYDIKNNIPLIDYSIDPSDSSGDPVNSKIIHLGLRKDKDENGIFKYKVRITEHLKNILLKDSTNTKLGLVLSTNINYINTSKILKSEDVVNYIPSAAILTSRGTILHGTNTAPENESKKMKLEIFFTDPNN